MVGPTIRIGAPLHTELTPALQWIEVATFFQIPSFSIVGLPGPEVSEAKERVRAAIEACGLAFPKRRVVVNLSPADVRKSGTGLDLAVALAILQEQEASLQANSVPGPDEIASKPQSIRGTSIVAWGELGLDGTVKPSGHITRTLFAAAEAQVRYVVIPHADIEAARDACSLLMKSSELRGPLPIPVGVHCLDEAWNWIERWRQDVHIDLASTESVLTSTPPALDSRQGKQDDGAESTLLALSPALERCLGVSAAGCHHLLLLGPRGTGKSQAIEWLRALRLPNSPDIELHRRMLEELAGGPQKVGANSNGPYRRISSHVRVAALIGQAGSRGVRPGEFSLAHGGLLIADELPEWSRDAREALREPLERNRVTLTRAQGSRELPARFTLAATGNLCPCGGWPPQVPLPLHEERSGSGTPKCSCSPRQRRLYLERMSGPIMDRLDLIVMQLGLPGLTRPAHGRARAERLREQVRKANALSVATWGKAAGEIKAHELEDILGRKPAWLEILASLRVKSLRSRHKLARVAMTLANWEGSALPSAAHFMEASCYRPERFGFCE